MNSMVLSSILFASSSFVLSFVFVKFLIVLSRKFDWYDEVDPRKIHKGAIPRLGGIGLFVAFFITLSVFCVFDKDFDKGSIPFLVSGFIIWLTGAIDDFKNLRARVKFLIQFVSILFAVIFSPYYLSSILYWEIPVFLGKILTFLWIIVLVNAFNLIDGLDWLCSGLSVLSIATLTILMYLNNLGYMFGVLLCMAILGFMIHNKPPAKIFLGDSGSQTLGFCIAVLPLYITGSPQFNVNLILVQILCAIIPVTDVFAAIIRRLRERRSIFSTDRGHIHHKLLNIGFSKVISLLYLLGLQFLICAVIVFSQFMGAISSLIFLIAMIVFIEVFFVTIHYINRAVNRKLVGCLSENAQEEH